MFCKYCGNRIGPTDPVCTNCGRPVTLDGGNGFWDLAGKPKVPAQPLNPVVKEKVIVKEVKKPAVIPMAISAALCLLFLILLVAGNITNKKTIKEINKDHEAQLSQQKAQYENQIGQLQSEIALLEDDLIKAAAPQIPVKVTWSPTPETEPIGYINRDGTWLFKFEIDGSAISFQWEKQQTNGEWVELIFGDDRIDPRFGLKIDEDLQQGSSKLVAVGLTENSDGNYKCTVITENGSESVEVRLTIESNSASVSTPTTTVTPEPVDEPEPGTDEDKQSSEEPEVPESDPIVGWNPWGGHRG